MMDRKNKPLVNLKFYHFFTNDCRCFNLIDLKKMGMDKDIYD